MHRWFASFLIPCLALLMLFPSVPSWLALALGVAVSFGLTNPHLAQTRALAPRLLSLSVVGLGAGMNLAIIGKVGLDGLGYTIAGIGLTLSLGLWMGRRFKTDTHTSLLLTVGTAICGGSAIAALAPVIRAKSHEVSVALGIVFLLNAVALLVFPVVGRALGLSEAQFGLWCALAIHDTSSVVGATLVYGPYALAIGTTVKLARALWIFPVTLGMGFWHGRQSSRGVELGPVKRPWFILGFLVAAAIVTWMPALRPAGEWINAFAKRLLVMTLFLIGTHLNRETLRSVGARPLLQGALLWACVASASLFAIIRYGASVKI